MSGSNFICVASVLLETGIAKMVEPKTHLMLEAPGGVIRVIAACRDGKTERTTVTNLASFAAQRGLSQRVDGVGKLVVDTAYGGR